jgi:hypothetical protein
MNQMVGSCDNLANFVVFVDFDAPVFTIERLCLVEPRRIYLADNPSAKLLLRATLMLAPAILLQADS